jgi:glycosyltransferase involved in cell wall biosynthesis
MAKSPKILFLGELPPAEVRKILDQSRVFCLLSSYEGLSHALLEAMSSQIPVVVSDIPGNKHVISHLSNGLLVDYQNQSEIGEAISQLLQNRELAKKLSDRALVDLKSNHSETTQIAKMVTLIEES